MSERCQFCEGDGWYSEMEHSPYCTILECVDCPVEVQVKCENCDGTGRVGE